MAGHWGWIEPIADFELGEVQVRESESVHTTRFRIFRFRNSLFSSECAQQFTQSPYSFIKVFELLSSNSRAACLISMFSHSPRRHTFFSTQVAIQNFTIVIEMFITAIAHKYVFGHEAYADGSLKIIMDARAAAWKEQTDPNSYAVRQLPFARDALWILFVFSLHGGMLAK
jgi:hypothetical protein